MSASRAVSHHVYSRRLEDSEKVAVLLLALDKSLASQLLQHFEHDEITRIRGAADSLEPITADDLEAIVEEFANQVSTGLNFVGTPGEVHDLLNTALSSDEDEQSAAQDGQPSEDPTVWAQLAQMPDDLLASFLQSEHPQTIAVVLSNTDSECSAKIVAQLPQQLSTDIMRRMLSLKPLNDDVVSLLEEELRLGLQSEQEQGSANAAHPRIANMINRMDGDQRQQIIDSIMAVAPDEAEAIKKLLFSFEDVEQLSEKACQVLFGEVPADIVVTALNGAGAMLRERVLSSLSPRSRRMVETELTSGSDVLASDIAEARLKIAGIALGLIESGQIQTDEEDG